MNNEIYYNKCSHSLKKDINLNKIKSIENKSELKKKTPFR